jgi:hypothetical protein
MIISKIEKNLIDEFTNDQYNIIEVQYKKKLEKSNKNLSKLDSSKKRNKEISNLIKNKLVLEQSGVHSKYINNYIQNQYLLINNKYNNNLEYNNEFEYNIEFLD